MLGRVVDVGQSSKRVGRGSLIPVTFGGGISRENFTTAARSFAGLVDQIGARPMVRTRAGGVGPPRLVGHTSRSLITVETYLEQPATHEELATPAAYLAAVARRRPSAVAERGRAAGGGPRERSGTCRARAWSTGCCLWSTGGRSAGHHGRWAGCGCSSYLPTRSFELVVHGLDIVRAAELPEPATATGAGHRGARRSPRLRRCSAVAARSCYWPSPAATRFPRASASSDCM